MTESEHSTSSVSEALGFLKSFETNGLVIKNITISIEWALEEGNND